jgi:hypothetical protein
MRTTLTLDEDVAARVKAECRSSGRSFKETVNEVLRRGLAARPRPRGREPFKVEARDLGGLAAGLSLDSVARLLDQVEGPVHR